MPLFDRNKRTIRAAGARRRAGDAHGAIEMLANVLTEDPGDVTANAEMARALRIIGDPKGAEEYLRLALKSVLDYQLVVELGGVLAEQGRVKDAEDTIDAALAMAKANQRLDPGEALLVRAAIAAGQGRKQDAKRALDEIPPKRASASVKEYAARLRATIDT